MPPRRVTYEDPLRKSLWRSSPTWNPVKTMVAPRIMSRSVLETDPPFEKRV
jgi:hypothetical protein